MLVLVVHVLVLVVRVLGLVVHVLVLVVHVLVLVVHVLVISDLQTTDDLADVDKKRKEEFKKYEMNKEHEYRQQLKNAADDEAREKLKKEHEEKLKRHKEHPKVHHPVCVFG